MSDTRTCPQCEREFEPRRPHQIYDSEQCRYQGWIQKEVEAAQDGPQRVEGHPLAEVREQHEQVENKARWAVIVREHLNRTLLQTGYVSAEDFEPLGIPDQHCNLANAQMGGYVAAGYMEPITWRRSPKASRKSGKIWTYKLTEKGREKLSATAPAQRKPEPAPDVATDLQQTEQRLFEVPEPVPISSSSAFNPDNEWA